MGAFVLDSPWIGQSYTPPTPLDIGTIEAAIVSRLNAQITMVEIAHFPDKPEAYRMTHRIGAALIRYEGAEYGEVIDSGAIVQERTLKFEVTLMMRDLGWSVGGPPGGGDPGAYAMIESIRGALTGFRVPGCDKTYPLRERFIKRDKQGGVWIYAISFGMRTAAVEASVPDNYPLLTVATAEEQGGITTVSVGPALYQFNQSGQVELPNGNVSAVLVTNVSTGALYAAGTDYALDTVNGIIALSPAGTITTGASVNVAYTYAEIVTAISSGGIAPTAPTN
jgi:Gp37 protein